MNRTWAIGALGACFWFGCSAENASSRPPATAAPRDAGATPASRDVGRPETPSNSVPVEQDGGGFTGVPSSQEGQALMPRVQINGGSNACGSCAVVLAQVQGGKQPYSYAWNDPELSGPGPHQVCPDEPTEYAVVVTDSSAVEGAEFGQPAQSVRASAMLDCTQSPLDGGPQDAGDFVGCTTMLTAGTETAGADSGVIMCETGDGGWYSGTGQSAMNMRLRAGHTYNLSYDQLIPIVVGEPVSVEIWGSNTPCAMEEKLATWTLDGAWHHPGCFTPTRDFNWLLVRVHVGFTLFYFNLLQSATFCAGCEEPEL